MSQQCTVKILVVIITTISWLIFFTTMSPELLDDNVVTHVMCIANLNLLDDSVVTYDERVIITERGYVVLSLR